MATEEPTAHTMGLQLVKVYIWDTVEMCRLFSLCCSCVDFLILWNEILNRQLCSKILCRIMSLKTCWSDFCKKDFGCF